jgi:cell wall-associated NlpC family hydrolase
MHRFVVALVVALAAAPAAPAAAAEPEDGTLVSVHIVSRVGDAGIADESPKHARAAQGVTLYAVLQIERHGHTLAYSDAGRVRLGGGKPQAARPLAQAGALTLRWYRVEPGVEDMSNEQSGKFRYEPIPYDETEIAAWRDQTHPRADVHPTRTPDRGGGLGTMRYKLAVVRAGVTRATPGAEARRGSGSGGLTDAVHRVSLRGDDSYLGWLGELYGQPYIWASAGGSNVTHQSERLEGSDCADFVVYGWRRLGHDVPYTWTGGLPGLTRLRASGARDPRGVYVDARGVPLAAPAPGDLLLFPRHVGVFVRDLGVAGVLDDADVMVHALFESPHEQALADSGYADRPVEVRRWK